MKEFAHVDLALFLATIFGLCDAITVAGIADYSVKFFLS